MSSFFGLILCIWYLCAYITMLCIYEQQCVVCTYCTCVQQCVVCTCYQCRGTYCTFKCVCEQQCVMYVHASSVHTVHVCSSVWYCIYTPLSIVYTYCVCVSRMLLQICVFLSSIYTYVLTTTFISSIMMLLFSIAFIHCL